MNTGIDYGLGRTNIDTETGIRFGVISQNSVGQAWFDSSEPDYGPPHCPKCGNEVGDLTERHCDYHCEDCDYDFDGEEAFGDEPNGFFFDDEGYKLSSCLVSDIMVIKSPFYTFGQFCSPCVPGAVNLDTPMEEGAKAYCLGHDWFEGGKAPYPVYSVETGKLIEPA